MAVNVPGPQPQPNTNWTKDPPSSAFAQYMATLDGALRSLISAFNTQPAPNGTLVSVIAYSGSQTITIPVGATRALIQMWGATGGSGGVPNPAASGGTGAGGYLEKLLSGLTPGNTLIYTQGAAGTAGTSAPGNGGNGGVTTLASGTQTIAALTCNPSNGSLAPGASNVTSGTLGGTATGGDINVPGQPGTAGAFLSTFAVGPPGGIGGATFFSLGANGQATNSAATAGNPGNPGGLKITWMT